METDDDLNDDDGVGFELHRKIGRRRSDYVFYWMPLWLGLISLLSALYTVGALYWQIKSDLRLIEYRVEQLEKPMADRK